MTTNHSAVRTPWLTDDRRLTLIGMAIGAVLWGPLFISAYLWLPLGAPPDTVVERVLVTLRLCVMPAGVLQAFMILCARLFDTPEAENPSLELESPRWKTNQRILTNTVEQGMIFLPTLLGLASVVPAAQFRLVTVLAGLWCFGRVIFSIGYHLNPAYRTPGFECTMFSTFTAFGAFLYFL